MTWIEFIVVIVLIGVLAGLVLPSGGPKKGTRKLVQARKDMADLASAIAIFRHDNKIGRAHV